MSDGDRQSGGAPGDRFSVDFTGVTLLSTYRVDEKLAEGGMGSIYRAEDTNLGRPVVVKVPHPRFLGEPGFRGRFTREVAELVRLEHPHIARILAQGEHDDIPFFVLQFLGGGSLEDRQADAPDRRLSPAEVIPWLVTIAKTLDYVNERGIVHRDVKPANILFDEGGHVFLSDFGVAKALKGEDASLTGTGVAIGSPKHMAPEQGYAEGVGPAADQYGLASTLYEVITGSAPFGDTKLLETLVRKSTEEARDIREHLPNLPEHAATVVMRGLAREPAERFPSCLEFAEAFAAPIRAEASTPGLGTGSIPATTPPSPTGPTPPARRRPGHLVAAVLVLFALGVGAWLAFRPDRTVPEPAPESPPAPAPPVHGNPVVLVDAGVEPRQVLRYRVASGAKERLRFTSEMNITLGPDAGQENMLSPPMVMDADVQVEEVTENGLIQFSWEVIASKAVPKEGVPQHRVDLITATVASLVGKRIWADADDRGRLHSFRVGSSREEAKELEGDEKALASSLAGGVEELLCPLPEEPVGPGARWEVTRVITQLGMRQTHTLAYELIAIEGYRVRIEVAAVFAAPKQNLDEAFGGDVEVKLESMHGTTNGEIRLDLTQLVPFSSHLKATMAFSGSRGKEGEAKEPFTIDTDVSTLIERR